MSAIHLASAGVPELFSANVGWRWLASLDERGRHHLVDDPDAADIVLFTDCHQLGSDWKLDTIRTSAIAREHHEKVYVYDQRDRPWCAFPGVYVSMPEPWFEPRFQSAWSYVPTSEPHVMLGLTEAPEIEPDLLVSFVGSPTHPLRRELVALSHPRGHFESVEGFLFHDWRSDDFDARRAHFAEVLFRSKFVLCPRGHGTSSIRLFEALAAGRVPVIVSDDWVPPLGPDWDSISVRWPERGPFDALLRRLEELEPAATEMGVRARAAFDEWLRLPVLFDRVAELFAGLAAHGAAVGFPPHGVRGRAYARLVAVDTVGKARHLVRSAKARM
ncbi:MAG TPA: exostosin family protein [Acidimicrobiia bacterium]|jgi:hypothetical protein